MLSFKRKKVRDEIYFLLVSKDWRKKLFKGVDGEEIGNSSGETNAISFYSFWLQGRALEEKQAAFNQFLQDLNKGSKDGELFQFDDDGKIKIISAVHASAINKSLVGFLRFCIEERKVLSANILHHKHRELLRNVFILNSKDLVFLEGQRYLTTPADYTDVYRQALKN